MDLNMPVMDGFEATRQILELQDNPRHAHLPKVSIAALTAYTDEQNITKCKEVKMVEVLNKPASCKDIMTLVSKFCPLFEPKWYNIL